MTDASLMDARCAHGVTWWECEECDRMMGPVDLIHDRCGGVAFRYRFRPSQGTPVMAADAILLDGTQPEPHGMMVCGSCGSPIHAHEVKPDGGWA